MSSAGDGSASIILHIFMSDRIDSQNAMTAADRKARRKKILGRDPRRKPGLLMEDMDPDDVIDGMKQMMHVRIKRTHIQNWFQVRLSIACWSAVCSAGLALWGCRGTETACLEGVETSCFWIMRQQRVQIGLALPLALERRRRESAKAISPE